MSDTIIVHAGEPTTVGSWRDARTGSQDPSVLLLRVAPSSDGPDAPSGLSADLDEGDVLLTWTAGGSDADGQLVLRSADGGGSGGTWEEVADLAHDAEEYRDTVASGTYHYRIRSYYTGGGFTDSNEADIEV